MVSQNVSTADINIVEGVVSHKQKLPRAKRTEVNLLVSAQASTVSCQVSVLVPTRGIFTACLQNADFAGQMSSRIIFEVSRLLKTYPMFNAGYLSEHIVYYDEINVGYAVDIQQGLKVPIFRGTDHLTLEEIHQKKQKFIEKYLLNDLTTDDLSCGTFTITDLSEQGCWLFNPIINKGQSGILGIGGEQPLGNKGSVYPLILGFDHRLTEGLTANKFLVDLKERLIAHENLLLRQIGLDSYEQKAEEFQEPYCQSCFLKASQIYSMDNHLFKTITADGKERLVCSVCAERW
jgi:pyruvate dehydrogenase E2 component (dihydrolipoamide acetyltransferase)